MESHQPPLSPPISNPYIDEPPPSIPSTSSSLKDKQVEDYSQWEKVIIESAATAYLKQDSLPYHLPTLPLPLIQHQSILKQRELAPKLSILDNGKVLIEGLSQEVLDTIVEKQPTWQAKWFWQRPIDKVLYNLAPVALQCDPIYCPIRCRKSWESY